MMVFNPSVSGGGSKETVEVTVAFGGGIGSIHVIYLDASGSPQYYQNGGNFSTTIHVLKGSIISAYSSVGSVSASGELIEMPSPITGNAYPYAWFVNGVGALKK